MLYIIAGVMVLIGLLISCGLFMYRNYLIKKLMNSNPNNQILMTNLWWVGWEVLIDIYIYMYNKNNI
jgi:hypothetical protein